MVIKDLSELVDLAPLCEFFESVHKLIRVPISFVNAFGKVVFTSGFGDICEKFYYKHPETFLSCRRRDEIVLNHIRNGKTEKILKYKCKIGFLDYIAPGWVGDHYCGSVIIGQFLLKDKKRDISFFRQLAIKRGFPLKSYLASVRKAPTFSRKDIHQIMGLIQGLINCLRKWIGGELKSQEINRALQDNQTRLQRMLENAEDFIIVIDREWKIQFLSPSLERQFGFPKDYLYGKNALDLIHPRDRKKVFNAFNNCIDKKEDVVHVDFEMQFRDGSSSLFQAIGRNLIDDPLIKGFVITYRKMSSEAKALQTTLDWKKRYDMVVSASGQIFYEYDIPSGEIIWGGSIEEVLGFSLSEMSGGITQWMDMIHPDDRDEAVRLLEIAEKKCQMYDVKYRFKHKTKGYVWIHDRGNFVLNSEGKSEKMLGLMADITEQYMAMEAVKLNEKRLETLVKLSEMSESNIHEICNFAMEEAIKLTNSKVGYLGFVNEAQTLITMYAFSKSALAECSIANKPVEFEVEKTGLWGEAIRQRRPIITNDYSAPNPYKKGYPPGHVHLTRHLNVPIFDHGKIVVLVGVGNKETPYDESDVRQLTLLMSGMWQILQRQRAEREKLKMEATLRETQKLESLGVLAGGVAHDFNNLLTGILGNASLAKLHLKPDSKLMTYLTQIEKASQRAAELCKQMLAYSGKGKFFVQKLNLNALIEDTTPLLEVCISKKVSIKFHFCDELPPISADASQIRQIIMNLVLNASEAIGDQQGLIILKTGKVKVDQQYLTDVYPSGTLVEGEYVFLEVSDTGCGMSPEVRKKIFDPFFSTKFTGRGLGLAVVLGIVRGHKGAIKVYSEPGKGSTFKLIFPIAKGEADPISSCQPSKTTWKGCGYALVIDDEEAVRRVATQMLESIGFEVQTAKNGLDALEVIKNTRQRFDLVLLDLTMPQMDGEEFFSIIKRRDPEVQVILMSGFNEQDTVNRFLGKGLGGFLQKPFTIETLVEKIEKLFSAKMSHPKN